MKGVRLLFIASIFLVFLTTCGYHLSSSKEEREYFPDENHAIEHYIQERNIDGFVDLLTTTKDERLLVTEVSDHTYFIGEVAEEEKGFFTAKLTANYQSETGGAWELDSIEGTGYTVHVDAGNESKDTYTIFLEEGHTISEEGIVQKNAIKKIENVKK